MENFQSDDAYANSLLADSKLEDDASQKPQKTFELSECRIWLSVLLNLVSPLCGYIHTRRFSALAKLFGISFVSLLALQAIVQTTLEESEDMEILVGLMIPIAAAVDNTNAIKQARKEKADRLAFLTH